MSKKKERKRQLSVIVEASEGAAHARTPAKVPAFSPRARVDPRSPRFFFLLHPPPSSQTSKRKMVPIVDANHFEYVRTLRARGGAEVILARKIDQGLVYTVKLARKAGGDVPGPAATVRIRREQEILKVLAGCAAPFVARLWWSFDDERAMYLVIVSAWRRAHRAALTGV